MNIRDIEKTYRVGQAKAKEIQNYFYEQGIGGRKPLDISEE